MQPIALYHKDCIDGTTAAAVFLRKFPEAKVFPISHKHNEEEFDPIMEVAQERREVYTLDNVIGVAKFLEAGVKVTSLDHHIGVQEEFEKLANDNDNYIYIFDNDKSGASLTWTYFFPDEDMPELIKYVEDSDLWRWQYGQIAKDVNHYLHMFRNNPKEMWEIIESRADEAKKKGAALSEYIKHEVDIISKRHGLTARVGQYDLPAFNITSHEYQSECGNILSAEHNSAVVLFTISGQEVKIRVNSQDNQEPSALDIAKTLGGGGHRNASGAVVSLKDFLQMIKA